MLQLAYHTRRAVLYSGMVNGLKGYASLSEFGEKLRAKPAKNIYTLNASPKTPEDFQPLQAECFQNPYPLYKLLRDQYPLYKLKNGVFCLSRYQDIVEASRNVEVFSSAHQGIVANLPPGKDLLKEVRRFDLLSKLGLIPADVLATADQPAHTEERKIGHTCLNSHFVKQLESEVENLCRSMMDQFIGQGEVEFMQAFGWRLPMIFVMRLLGLPEQDFKQIKQWCVDTLNSQNGIQTGAELLRSQATALTFLNYCWQQYLQAKKNPQDNLMGIFAQAARSPDKNFDDKKAASAIFQLLIAGSDSSATTMGNALKMLIDHPELQEEMRQHPEQIPAFIEEVLRLESAFQGHFRWTKQDTEMHGIKMPKGSRVFLMWASGNRDERFWDQPDTLLLNRKNGKKHLTFGHGIHACIGRELARMEIRVVLSEFLCRTKNIKINGETPYVASMFARTLLKLPITFTPV